MLYSIQFLRGLAALLVAVGHIPLEAMPAPIEYLRGAIGVDLFFIISGFIMAYTTRTDTPGTESAKSFLIRRLIRIYPLYWSITLLITVFVVVTKVTPPPSIEHFFYSLFLIPESVNGEFLAPVIPAGWTLSFEMYFYLIFSFFLTFKRLNIFIVSIFFLFLIFCGFVFEPKNPVLALMTAPILFEFLFGILTFYFWENVRIRIFKYIGAMSLIIGLPIFCYVKTITTLEYQVTYGNSQLELFNGLMIERCLIWGLPALLLFIGTLSFEKYFAHSAVRNFFLFAGNISYSFYLLHQAIFAFLNGHISEFQPWHFLIYLGILTLASYVFYRGLELPSARFLRKKLLGNPIHKTLRTLDEFTHPLGAIPVSETYNDGKRKKGVKT